MCEAFSEEPEPTHTLEIHIENTTATPLYIGEPAGCGQPAYFDLQDSEGEALLFELSHCAITCPAAMADACACSADCPIPRILKLDPGSTYVTQWHGTVWRSQTLPAACVSEFCGDSCVLGEAAPEDTYTVGVTASRTCSGTSEQCECQVNADGWCQLDAFDDLFMPRDQTAETAVDYPASGPAVVTFVEG